MYNGIKWKWDNGRSVYSWVREKGRPECLSGGVPIYMNPP